MARRPPLWAVALALVAAAAAACRADRVLEQRTVSAAATLAAATPQVNLTFEYTASANSSASFFATAAITNGAGAGPNGTYLAYSVVFEPPGGPPQMLGFALMWITDTDVVAQQALGSCSEVMDEQGTEVFVGNRTGTWTVRVLADPEVFELHPDFSALVNTSLTIQESNASVPMTGYGLDMTVPAAYFDLGFTPERFDPSRRYDLSVSLYSATFEPLLLLEYVLVRESGCPELAFLSLLPFPLDDQYVFEVEDEGGQPPVSLNYTIPNAEPGDWHAAVVGSPKAWKGASMPIVFSFAALDTGSASSPLASSSSSEFWTPAMVMLVVGIVAVSAVVLVVAAGVLVHLFMRRRAQYDVVL